MGKLYKQAKFCEDCGVFFDHESIDAPNDAAECPENSEHTVRDNTILSERTYGELYFLPNHNSNYGNFPSREIQQGANDYFMLPVPLDFLELISCELVCIATDNVTDVDIDIDSAYGNVGEDKGNHTESVSDGAYTFNADEISELDLSGILTGIAAGDHVGIHVVHNSIGITMHYIAIRLRYKINNLCC